MADRWTPEEDRRLCELVNECRRNQTPKMWMHISQIINRTPLSARSHWDRMVQGEAKVRAGLAKIETRLVVIQRTAGTAYRLLYLSPPNNDYDWEQATVRASYSLAPLRAGDNLAAQPMRVRVVPASGRGVQDLSRSLPFGDGNEAWFRVLNRLAPGTDGRRAPRRRPGLGERKQCPHRQGTQGPGRLLS